VYYICHLFSWIFTENSNLHFFMSSIVTGQFADKPTRGQSSRGLVNSRASQHAETFGLKLAVNTRYKYDLQ